MTPERVTGDLSLFTARAGLETVEAEGRWESSFRLGLLGYGCERYDAVVGGVPETYRCEGGGAFGPFDSPYLGFGVGLTRRLSERLAATWELYLSSCLGFAEWNWRVEMEASRSVSLLVGYTKYDQSCWGEDPAGGTVEMSFVAHCLATGVVCRF